MRTPSRIRKLASETAIYGVSSVAGRLVNFLLFPFYSHVFPPDVYEPVVVIYAAFVFLNVLFQHGMESSYLKFASTTVDERGRRSVFGSALSSICAVSLVLSAVMIGFPGWTGSLIELDPVHANLLTYAAIILVLDAVAVVPFADLRLSNRPWRFATIRSANIVLNVGLNLYLILVLEMGVEAVLLANVAASGLTLLLLSPTMLQRAGRPDRALLKRMWSFGYPFILGGLGYAVTERINIIFLKKMPNDRVVELYGDRITDPALIDRLMENGADYITGAYGGIIKLAVLMTLFVQMFRYAWQPFFLQRQGDKDAPELFGRIFVLLSVVLAVVFLGVSFFADNLVRIPIPGRGPLINPAYWIGLNILPVALAGYVFQGWYYHFSAGAYIKEKSGFLLPSSLAGSLVALVLNAFLVPRYGMMAAASATAGSYLIACTVLYFLIRPHYRIPYSWGRVLSVFVLSGILFWTWTAVESLRTVSMEALLIVGFMVVAAAIVRKAIFVSPSSP